MIKAIIPSFIIGAAVGAASAWFVTSRYKDKQLQEEIDSVKKAFSDAKKEAEPEVKEEPKVAKSVVTSEERKTDITEYAATLSKSGYTHYSNYKEDESETEGNVPVPDPTPITKETPYVVAPDDFGELEGYDIVCYTYFADGVLADENDEVVHDVDDMVGEESLNHFGEYEEDTVHVRNDNIKTDFEITKDLRTYSEFLEDHPYKAGL